MFKNLKKKFSAHLAKSLGIFSFAIALSGVGNNVFSAPIPVATYDFHDATLNANEAGIASLVAIDPQAANTFITDNVLGVTKTVYRFDGSSVSGQQGGLSLNTTGLGGCPRIATKS